MKAFFSFVDTSPSRMLYAPMPALIPQLPDVVERFRNGESVQQIAVGNRAGIRTIYRHLLRELGPDYHAIQRDLLVARIADSDQMLLEATNAWEVNRAIACAKFSRFDYERRATDDFGPKQAVAQDVRVTIRDIRPAAPVLEAGPVVVLVPDAGLGPAEDGGDTACVDAARESLPVGEATHE